MNESKKVERENTGILRKATEDINSGSGITLERRFYREKDGPKQQILAGYWNIASPPSISLSFSSNITFNTAKWMGNFGGQRSKMDEKF
ncbi:hypothetical protein V6N11_079882 [Hibiscus sabdariffa]|uniref:Uncharacterized protein n=1 Tax=Hibiscus sabdariffa TaxID=183260 RepID=A0ABR2RWN8_9ROSI